MIKSVDTIPTLLQPQNQPRSTAAGTPVKAMPSDPPPGLANSIMPDGGLSFLRGRLESKLDALFEKAAELNPELAAAGPSAFFDTSVDVSPEATADRIVGFALGLKGVFVRQNENLGEDELMAGFESEIRRGIGEGFGEARSILQGLDLLSGDVEVNVDATWDLVQQRLDEYFHPEAESENPDEG